MTSELSIERVVEPERAPFEHLIGIIRRHNDVITGIPGVETVAFLMRDGSGALIGGAWTEVRRNWMHLDVLAVEPAYQRRGLGRRLLGMAIEEARTRNLAGIYLDALDPDAKRVYERAGFRVFGTLPDHPPVGRWWMVKRLNAKV